MSAIMRKLCNLVARVEDKGRREGGTLLSVPSDLIEDLKDAAEFISDLYFFGKGDKAPHVMEQLGPDFWVQMLVVHGWALRDIVALQRNPENSASASKLCGAVCVFPQLLKASGALFPPNKHRKRLMSAIFGSDLLACYAAVFAALSQASTQQLNDSLTVCSLLSLVLMHIGRVAGGKSTDDNPALFGVAVSHMPFKPSLYRDWLDTFSETSVLEHATKAYLCLEASARVALETGNCSVQLVRVRLAEINTHLSSIVDCMVDPHLKQPILSLSPRPLQRPFPDAINSTIRVLRKLLSGTCLQFWLGKQLIDKRLLLTDGEGTTHGMPAVALLPAPLQPIEGHYTTADVAPSMQHFLNLCITVWQVTVSGPRPPTPAVALGRCGAGLLQDQVEDFSLPGSMPYRAANVYDMSFEATWSVVQRLPELEPAGVANLNSLSNTLRLLVRLIMELKPDDAAARLPGLWRAVAHMTPSLCARPLQYSQSVCRFCLTLLQMVLATERAGGLAGANAGVDEPWECLHTLRCALEARFLPALELSLRRLASHGALFAAECVSIVHVVLCVSGLWPAMLAHGSQKEVASLIATLRKVARALHGPARAGAVGALAAAAAAGDGSEINVNLLALMEQAVAVVLQPWNLPAPPARAAGSGRRQARAAGATAAAATAAKQKLIELTNSMEQLQANQVTVEWLVQAGGRPPEGSPAGERQRLMAVFAMVQWLPHALRTLGPNVSRAWSTEMGRAVSRGVLLAALQCMVARGEVTLVASGLSGDTPPPPSFQRFFSWRKFLFSRLYVLAWLARIMGLPDHTVRDHPDLVPGALDVLEVLTAALPMDVQRQVTLGGGAAAAAATISKPAVTLADAVLLRYGRKSLRAALVELQKTPVTVTLEDGSLVALQALRREVAAKHALACLPVLPSPLDAERAAEEAGVKHCGNTECNALEGAAQESEVVWKRCSRCRAVHYCCSGCQRVHWDAGHKRECAPASG